jgi:hypothetical protein
MRSNGAAASDVAQREQKERGLRQFIESFLVRAEDWSAAGGAERACLLLARSPDSPVARVIAEFAQDTRVRLPIRAIFTTLEAGAPSGGPDLSALPAFAAEIRLARDPRLLDAHEQLVLGSRTSWIGDCMRRDPLKRDAYEAYSADGRGKALRAVASFERMWRVATPVSARASDDNPAGAEMRASCVGAISQGGRQPRPRAMR